MYEFLESGVKKFEEGKLEDALNDLSKFLVSYPNEIKGLYHRGLVHRKLANYKASLADFNTALRIKENDPDLLCDRAITYFHMGNRKLSIRDVDKAAEIEPNKAFRYSSRAFLKGKFGDIESAIEDYKQAIALDPSDAVAYNNLGLLEEQLGRKDNAQKHFLQADFITKGEKHGPTDEKTQKLREEIIDLSEKQKSDKKKQIVKEAPLAPKQSPKDKKKVTIKVYFRTITDLLGSKEERKQFIDFIKTIFKKK